MVMSTRFAASLTLTSTPLAARTGADITAAATTATHAQRILRLLCIRPDFSDKVHHMSTHFKLATTLALTAAVLAPLGAQAPKTDAPKKPEATMKADGAKANASGWTQLFDGKTL